MVQVSHIFQTGGPRKSGTGPIHGIYRFHTFTQLEVLGVVLVPYIVQVPNIYPTGGPCGSGTGQTHETGPTNSHLEVLLLVPHMVQISMHPPGSPPVEVLYMVVE